MKSVSQRSARWLRVSLIGAVAAAFALVGGIALAAPQGNAPQVSTLGPDPVSFVVVINGTSTKAALGMLCFDKPIAAKPPALTNPATYIKLHDYGQTKILTPMGAATINTVNPDCLNLNFAVGSDLKGFTLATVTGGAVFSGVHPNPPGAVGVTAAIGAGFTTGPVLIGVSLNPTAGTATFTFNSPPTVADKTQFKLVNKDGSVSVGDGTAFSASSPNAVTVKFTPLELSKAVGGTVGPGAVKGGGGTPNAGPETSGISISKTPVTTTTTTTTINHTTINPPPPPRRRFNVNRVIIHAHKRRVAHGNTLVTFNGTVVVPSFLNKSRVCYGHLHITFKHGGRVVATGNRGLSRRCTFTGSKIISDRKLHNDGGRIFVRFGGNGRLFARGGASTGF